MGKGVRFASGAEPRPGDRPRWSSGALGAPHRTKDEREIGIGIEKRREEKRRGV
jgi:hypothetical protein